MFCLFYNMFPASDFAKMPTDSALSPGIFAGGSSPLQRLSQALSQIPAAHSFYSIPARLHLRPFLSSPGRQQVKDT